MQVTKVVLHGAFYCASFFLFHCAGAKTEKGSTAGGTPFSGGKTSGGQTALGGKQSTGGAAAGGANGGQMTGGGGVSGGGGASGGKQSTGGAVTSGGHPSTGGKPATGGAMATGGSGGSVATGGIGGNGGIIGTGGNTGGTVGTWMTCPQLTDAKVAAEYTTWKEKHLVECGTDKARVNKGGNTTVSEGIGYGLLIAAGMRDCDLVKRLYKFYLDGQAFTNSPANSNLKGIGLMPWVFSNGCDTTQAGDANFATDGDLDAAMGLLQADAVCADRGTFGYKAAAVNIIQALKKNAFLESNGKTILRGGGVGNAINPSYFAPAYYRAFAKATPEDESFWTKVITDTYSLLASYQTEMAGKWPDWGTADGKKAGDFYYDACRVPWRVATDFAWKGTPEAKTLLDTFRSTGMQNKLPYQATEHHNSAFIGAMALSAIGADRAKMDAFCADWLDRTVGTGNNQLDDSPYYQATLRLIYILLASGKTPVPL